MRKRFVLGNKDTDGKMWVRALRLVGIVVVSVFIGYLIGSNGLGADALLRAPAVSPFVVSNLSIQPAEVRPDEPITIAVSVANTHHTWGIYSLVLKVNGAREAQKQATVDAGSTQDVSFDVTRKELGRYTVFINGLSGSFTVVAPATVY